MKRLMPVNAAPSVRVGVMGAGAIGCFVGGMLAARGMPVVLIGRPALKQRVAEGGLTLTDLNGATVVVTPAQVRVETEAEHLRDCDVVLVCVKSPQSRDTAETVARILRPDAVVLSLQNGIRHADVLGQSLGRARTLATVVGFNVITRDAGSFKRTTQGTLLVERSAHDVVERVCRALTDAGVKTGRPRDIREHQWAKLVVNLNNAVSALSDVPTRELLLSAEYRNVMAAMMAEALQVLHAANVKAAPFGILPVTLFPRLLRLPTAVVRVVARAQLNVDPEARSSMWEDLQRGRDTEVDELNGEVVALAAAHGGKAPLNQRVVERVHMVEQKRQGSPRMSARALWEAIHS